MERGLTRVPEGEKPYTAEEIRQIQTKLWNLLGKQTQRYTMEESSSVRVETAQELLSSLLYCIRLSLEGAENRRETLLCGDYESLVREGLQLVDRQVREGLRRYQAVCSYPPGVTNRAYRDTVAEIINFFRHYDPQFFAHIVSCTIDYPLSLPVSEQLKGISYLNAYLERLMLENQLLRRFRRAPLRALLQAACVDYEDLLVNLYEPVFQNTIGLALLYRDVTELTVTEADRNELYARLEGLNRAQRGEALQRAAEELSRALGLDTPEERRYLSQSAERLLPRLNVVLEHHNLEDLFVSF